MSCVVVIQLSRKKQELMVWQHVAFENPCVQHMSEEQTKSQPHEQIAVSINSERCCQDFLVVGG